MNEIFSDKMKEIIEGLVKSDQALADAIKTLNDRTVSLAELAKMQAETIEMLRIRVNALTNAASGSIIRR